MKPDQPEQNPRPCLAELIARALAHLKELGYRERTRRYYGNVWETLLDFARARTSSPGLSRRLATEFLKSRGASQGHAQGRRPDWAQEQTRRGIRILLEFQEGGGFRRHLKRQPDRSVPGGFRRELAEYEEFCRRHLRHRYSTLSSRRRTLTLFFALLGKRGIVSPGDLKPSALTAFVKARASQIGSRCLATEVGSVRSFLRYLCMREIITPGLLAHARTLRFAKEHRLPPVWTEETVEGLLSAADRSSAVGKRDHAILLLACRFGLRASDIRTLRLDDLHWRDARITITQAKTQRPLSLPLDDDLGEALIDYLEHARPTASHREVFLKARAPHEPLGSTNSLYSVVASALRRSKIKLPPNIPRGLHALRHTLASRLVQRGESLDTVASILGHKSVESTRIYTHLDVDALRSVALDPEEVSHV